MNKLAYFAALAIVLLGAWWFWPSDHLEKASAVPALDQSVPEPIPTEAHDPAPEVTQAVSLPSACSVDFRSDDCLAEVEPQLDVQLAAYDGPTLGELFANLERDRVLATAAASNPECQINVFAWSAHLADRCAPTAFTNLALALSLCFTIDDEEMVEATARSGQEFIDRSPDLNYHRAMQGLQRHYLKERYLLRRCPAINIRALPGSENISNRRVLVASYINRAALYGDSVAAQGYYHAAGIMNGALNKGNEVSRNAGVDQIRSNLEHIVQRVPRTGYEQLALFSVRDLWPVDPNNPKPEERAHAENGLYYLMLAQAHGSTHPPHSLQRVSNEFIRADSNILSLAKYRAEGKLGETVDLDRFTDYLTWGKSTGPPHGFTGYRRHY